MSNKEDLVITNTQINLAYIFAGCMCKACEDMNTMLRKIFQDLKYDNKYQVNRILKISESLIKEIDKLHDLSIFKQCTNEDQYVFENDVYQYYVLLMNLIEIAGADNCSELRIYALNNFLKTIEHKIEFPIMEIRERMAFFGTKDRIEKGEWSDEDLEDSLKLKFIEDEEESETPES